MRFGCMAHGPRADLRSAKKKITRLLRKKAAKKKKASGTSKLLPSTTSAIPVRPVQLVANTTRKEAVRANPARHRSYKNTCRFDWQHRRRAPAKAFSASVKLLSPVLIFLEDATQAALPGARARQMQ